MRYFPVTLLQVLVCPRDSGWSAHVVNCVHIESILFVLAGTQDESFVAFQDIHPAASQHNLVITKAHVPSLYSLLPDTEDIKLGACCPIQRLILSTLCSLSMSS